MPPLHKGGFFMSFGQEILTYRALEDLYSWWYNTLESLENYGKMEDVMKRAITKVTIFLLFILLLAVPTAAEDSEGRVAYLSIESYPIKTVYGAFEQFDPSGLKICAVFEDGSRRLLDNNELELVLKTIPFHQLFL